MNNEINYLTVGELNNYIKKVIDNTTNLQTVYLKGEISNFKNHSRGHWYFTLKDEESRINAVMFSSSTTKVKFIPIDGMKVLIIGKVSAYPASGSYQIYVNEMESDGLGNLHIAFEQLKKKLDQEGLFDKSKKKRIPKMPKKIGIITASTGAAIKDIITTLKRRFPIAETLLFPSLVQGTDAAPSIVEQIKKAQNYNLDVLIIGRGGGSIEDLWAFNEEIVARAIYDSKVPIVSAVGHEIDYTISDFVSDLRAPTPTAAAEMVVPNQIDIFTYLKNVNVRSNIALKKKIDYLKLLLNKIKTSYVLKNPISIYQIKEQKLDTLIDKVNYDILNIIKYNKNRFNTLNNNYVLKNPDNIYKIKKEKFNIIISELNVSTMNVIKHNKNRLNNINNNYIIKNPNRIFDKKINNLTNILAKLKVLNPLNILEIGYSVVKKDDKVIKYCDIKMNDIINIKFKDGIVISKVIDLKEGE